MLYVERDNTPAQRLYESMGFTLHRRQLGYTAGGLGPANGAAGHPDGSAP
jgi:ribosomal protein S18 acetylase RimI-like enzyme